MLKTLNYFAFLSLVLVFFESQSANANPRLPPQPIPADCWFFRNEQLELSEVCTSYRSSWAGGAEVILEWQDGVRNEIPFGRPGWHGRTCAEVEVDGVCGSWSYRDIQTLEQISEAEKERRIRNEDISYMTCVDINDNSICWQTHQSGFIQPEATRNSFLESWLREELPSSPNAQYLYNRIDLNGDDRPDIIVHAIGQYFCGTGGCSTYIFENTGGDIPYRLIGEISVNHPPITVTNETHDGWKSLVVHTRNANRQWVYFDGSEYVRGDNISAVTNIGGDMLFATEYRNYVVEPFLVP